MSKPQPPKDLPKKGAILSKSKTASKPETSSPVTFSEYAKRFYNFEPSETQVKIVNHIIEGDKVLFYRPVRYGKSRFDEMAKAYIKHYRGIDLVSTDKEPK